MKIVQFHNAFYNACQRRRYLRIARIGMMYFIVYANPSDINAYEIALNRLNDLVADEDLSAYIL